MKPRIHHLHLFAIPTFMLIALVTSIPAWAQDSSRARAIRLSYVEGNVTIQRPDAKDWAQAPMNTPLQQGFKISTGEASFAEMQFENGGAIRLGEQCLMDLTELGIGPNGAVINRVNLHQGYGTFHPLPSRQGESFEVETPLGTLTAQGGTEFRVDLDQGMERVEVFQGSVLEESSMGSMTVQRDSVLVMQPGAAHPLFVSQGFTQDDWDQWVADREAHAQMASAGASPGDYSDDADGNPYGWGDLAQSGVWAEVDGIGPGWSPYTYPGWTPYSNGQWCWYPVWGYTWIGTEPWGWLPYHFGGWDYIPGRGWVWFPGSFRTWSPARVTWYQGADWVGWLPRSHRKTSDPKCETTCGGGVVSTGTFHNGGILSRNEMLGMNPLGGATVKAPRVSPSTAMMLPGAAVSVPASQRHGFSWSSPQPQAGTGTSASANPTLGPRHGGSANHNSAIVYDPQQGGYINGQRPPKPIVQPAFPGAAPTTNNVSSVRAGRPADPNAFQPVPVEGRTPAGGVTSGQEPFRPSRGVYASPPPSNQTPNNNSTGSRSGGGAGQVGASQTGSSRGGGWAPAEGHASSPPAGGGGGGHSAPPPAPAPAPSSGGAAAAHH
jgi:hypothetical protein